MRNIKDPFFDIIINRPQKSFSQLGQDLWVLEQYPNTKGYFVDIGCGDGILFSNTYLLELNGWHGIGIDPLPSNFHHRTNTKVYTNVLASKVEMVDYAITDNTLYSGIVNNINHHKQFLSDSKTIIKQVTTETLYNILLDAKSPAFIHYLNLDAEGSEYSILQDFPFHLYEFGCISVEHNYIEPQRLKINQLLKKNGYQLAKSLEWDDLYAKGSY